MDWNVMRRRRRMRRVSVLPSRRLTRADFPWIVSMGWMLAGLLLLPVDASAMLNGEGEITSDLVQQGILEAHPEWPPEMRAAVMAGIICAGMTPDMVRAAWGRPTRMSGRDGQGRRETWHYEGRPRAVERLGGQGMNDAAAREWTVSFIDGRVSEWTD